MNYDCHFCDSNLKLKLMKRKHNLIIILAFFYTLITVAQDFQGIATYKSKRKLNIKLDSTQINSDMHQRMMEMMKKQFEKTYKLSFNKEESVYKEEEKLGSPQSSGMQIVMVNTGGSDILYKNIKEERFTNQNDVFGKIFLIKDKLKKLDWSLSSETKNIGDYTCYKATIKRMQRVSRTGTISVNGDKDLDRDETEPEMEEITITAWYTPQISINSGPGNYYGLPGLILEVNDGTETVICSKIVMNPKKVNIVEPSKGKVVTQEKFDIIIEKKMKEMRERNKGRKDGHAVEIRIGG